MKIDRLLFVILIILIFPLTMLCQEKEKTENELLNIIDKLAEANDKKDTTTLNEIYAEEFFNTNSQGKILQKSEILDLVKKDSNITIISNTHDQDKVTLYNDFA